MSPACMTSSRDVSMFEDDVTWPYHALVMQGGSLGGSFGLVCHLKNVMPSLGCHSIV